MIKRRQFFQYAGLGGLGWIALSRDRTFTTGLDHALSSPKLNTFEFQTLTLNHQGTVTQTSVQTAQYFSETLLRGAALDMVAIAPGQFWMGATRHEAHAQINEFPRHRVKVAPFYMSRYPVTQAQWSAVASLPKVKRNLNPEPAHFHGGARPVESVSWLDATEFCDRLSRKTGRHYQLPTEAQWEYACRAGTQTPFSTGETITHKLADYIGAYAYRQESTGTSAQTTMPIGRYPPNAFGLQDMHGNVWEWCLNRWHPSYRASPKQSAHHSMRTIRGGGWLDAPANLRSARRSGYQEAGLNRTIGFRVVTV